jgi:hypothetical protein
MRLYISQRRGWKGPVCVNKLVGALALLLLGTTLASADVLPFRWQTFGSFSPVTSGLNFTRRTLGTAVSTDMAGNLNIQLGTLRLGNTTLDRTGTFSLTVDFVRPMGSVDPILGAPFVLDSNFNLTQDRLTIDFPDPVLLSFDGSDGEGSFTFGIEDVVLERTSASQITLALWGNITGAALTPVPEPTSVVLLGTLVGAVGLLIRKRLMAG